ncbi:MAG: hypothetical protein LBB57_01545, partial [Clostridiales Family XIII bacterium]|nr:hypothetical protein [Clostridiales Family XIII bacterium]
TSFLKKSKGDPKSTDGIKHRQFVALTKRLVEDASAYAANPSANPLNVQRQMKLVIDGQAVSDIPASNGAFYRGPYKIKDDETLLKNDPVFLETDGPAGSGAGAIGFYTKNADGSFGAISGNLTKYGYDNYSGPGIQKEAKFYIRVPDQRPLDGIAITALARTTVSAINMPVVLVHQDPITGEQDWKKVQAFIGLTANSEATVYGQAFLPLSSQSGRLTVLKNGANGTAFSFRLTDAVGNPVNLGTLPVSSADFDKYNRIVTNGQNGIFKLTAGTGDAAFAWTLPLGDYTITELDPGADYAVSYRINGYASQPGRIVSASLTSDVFVQFTNTSVPHPPPVTITIAKHSTPGALSVTPSVEGAVFALKKNDGSYSERAVVNAHGKASFTLLPEYNYAGGYTLTELLAPAYHIGLSAPVNFEIHNTGNSVEIPMPSYLGTGEFAVYQDSGGNFVFSIMNVYVPQALPTTTPVAITVVKHSDDGGVSVEGAEFVLRGIGMGNSYSESMTTTHGVITFTDLSLDSEYILTEVSAPANHIGLSGPIRITVDADGAISVTPAAADEASVLSYGKAGNLTLSVLNTYNPPSPRRPPSTRRPPATPPDGVTPPEPTPEEPTPDAPEQPDIPYPPNPDTAQEVTPPSELPQTGFAAGFDAPRALGALAMLLAVALLVSALHLRRRESGR